MIASFKKICFVGICGMIFTTQAQMANCTSEIGTKITGNDGTQLCLSKITMNWWSAHSWCRAIGLQLAPYTKVCGGKGPGDTWCDNWTRNQGYFIADGWTSTRKTVDKSYTVRPVDGLSSQAERKKQNHAWCVE